MLSVFYVGSNEYFWKKIPRMLHNANNIGWQNERSYIQFCLKNEPDVVNLISKIGYAIVLINLIN